MCDELFSPVFVTSDTTALPWAEEYTTLFGMYFIYRYSLGKNDGFYNVYHRTTHNPFIWLAQHCELSEQYVFYTPSNDEFQVICGGRVYINGYGTDTFIYDKKVKLYEIGHVYIAARKVSTYEEDMDVMGMVEKSEIAIIETTSGIWQILTGVERQDTLDMLRARGFIVDRSVTIDTMTFQVLTGDAFNPFIIYRDGKQIEVPVLRGLGEYLKAYRDVFVYKAEV